jgi:hypothetical protein
MESPQNFALPNAVHESAATAALQSFENVSRHQGSASFEIGASAVKLLSMTSSPSQSAQQHLPRAHVYGQNPWAMDTTSIMTPQVHIHDPDPGTASLSCNPIPQELFTASSMECDLENQAYHVGKCAIAVLSLSFVSHNFFFNYFRSLTSL